MSRLVHPELYEQKVKVRTFVRAIVVVGDIEVDGKPTKDVAVYVNMSELANGVSFADEFESWLFHLVKMCRYPDEKNIM